MNEERRINEIIKSMKSFSKEAYHRTEILPELFQLQKELVKVVFDNEHAKNSDLRIWDVERYLDQTSVSKGNVGYEELIKFKNDSKEICNRIKTEVSGQWGENKTFQRLENMKCSGNVIRNVELTSDGCRTEIDGVVVTARGIFLIEVKNTKKNILIDEVGNYYRTGNYMNMDSNIGYKMRNKVSLLKDALANKGIVNTRIESLVVFTNNRIEVNNHFDEIKTCFLGQLPYIIEDFKGNRIYTDEEISLITNIIEEVKCKEVYKFDLDIDEFKKNFAILVSKIEMEMARTEEKNVIEINNKKALGYKNSIEKCLDEKNEVKVNTLQQSSVAMGTIGGVVALSAIMVFLLSKSLKNQ